MIENLKKIQKVVGSHTVNTILYYIEVEKKYRALRTVGLSHIEASEELCVSESTMKKIISIIKECKNNCLF
jgi:tRNA A37 methylthiotransferase MiaB